MPDHAFKNSACIPRVNTRSIANTPICMNPGNVIFLFCHADCSPDMFAQHYNLYCIKTLGPKTSFVCLLSFEFEDQVFHWPILPGERTEEGNDYISQKSRSHYPLRSCSSSAHHFGCRFLHIEIICGIRVSFIYTILIFWCFIERNERI